MRLTNTARRCLAFAAVVVACALVLQHTRTSASETAITGEVVETWCWSQLRIAGPAHAKCGIACAKRGIPVALFDARTRKTYVLLSADHHAPLPPKLIEAMGQQVTIRGEVVARDGMQFLTVRSWK